jgi:uncharacterized protein (TIGR02266 family)
VSDHRAHPRVPLSVEVSLESENNFYAGLTDNISEGGVFVATHTPPARGTRVEFELLLDEQRFPIQGEVCWTRDVAASAEGAPPGCGIRWISISDAALRAVLRFIRARGTNFYED